MKEDLLSLHSRIIDLNKHLQEEDTIKDIECKKRLTDELDRTLYSYYKVLLDQMRSMDGSGDGI